MLNDSARNCSRAFSWKLKTFSSEMSHWLKPGPISTLRPPVPKTPCTIFSGGSAASVLNQRASVRSPRAMFGFATRVANPNIASGERTLARWFNTEAALPPEKMVQGVFGTGGRNVLIGPGFNQWDISLLKVFSFQEKARLQFRAESFNIVNHPSFTGIDTTARFDSAGRPAQTYGAVTGAGPARVLEF